MTHRIVGHTIGRLDGAGKVTGADRYSADVTLPGLIWGKALRSPLPHARIVGIDTSRAKALPGVLAVLTAADLPDILVGRRMFDMPLLARDRVRFIGEKVAVVAAVDPDVADEALAQIDVQYEDLPATIDLAKALDSGAPVVHENAGAYEGAPKERPHPNVQSVLRFKLGNVEAGFREADRIFEHTFRTQLAHQGYLEPHAGVVAIDADGRVQVWASNKMPHRLKELMSLALQLPQEKIRVNLTPIGGDFGGKGSLMDLPLAYHLSRVTGRPVKMVMRYAEELMAGNPRHPSLITMRTGVTNDGRIVARQVKSLFNSGAYAAFKPAPSVHLGGAGMGAGVYRMPNLLIESYCVYTHNIPCGHARSPGEPQMVFAGESHMDMIAKELGLDPTEFRRRNLLKDGDLLANGHHLEEVRAKETLEAALEASHWSTPKPGPWIGRGVAMTHRHIGVGFTNARVRLETTGNVTLVIALPDTGTGAHLTLRQVVAEVLGLAIDDVQIELATTDVFENDSGVGGSRVTHTGGRAAYHACEKLKELIAAETAKLGTPGASLAAIAQAAAREGRTLEASHFYDAKTHAAVTSFTAQVAEVAVDPATGQVSVRHFTTAHDVGTVINPIGHQGQIEGGLIQGLGYALMEELPTEDGRISTLNLGETKLPTIADIPPLTTVLVEDAVGPGPFRAKAIGEGSISAVAPAIANAVADACGVRILDLPITAEKVYFALRAKEQRAREQQS
ncbi:MAG TPA: xanthine dehydrogenase family protein molybdopterin-binding subunit [Burkholderiales bacterium]|nr:xanthine dehydrogenase family protein molybdopterin-binding subunit [Burkholderiales bacterium]